MSVIPPLVVFRRPIEAHFAYSLTERGIRAAYQDQRKINTTTIAGEWSRVDSSPQWPPAPKPPAFGIFRRAGLAPHVLGGYVVPLLAIRHALAPLCDVCGSTLGAQAVLAVSRRVIGAEDRFWRVHSELCETCAGAIPHKVIGRIDGREGRIHALSLSLPAA